MIKYIYKSKYFTSKIDITYWIIVQTSSIYFKWNSE